MNKSELENKVIYLYDLYWCGYMAMGLQDSPDAAKVKTELEEALSQLEQLKKGV